MIYFGCTVVLLVQTVVLQRNVHNSSIPYIIQLTFPSVQCTFLLLLISISDRSFMFSSIYGKQKENCKNIFRPTQMCAMFSEFECSPAVGRPWHFNATVHADELVCSLDMLEQLHDVDELLCCSSE